MDPSVLIRRYTNNANDVTKPTTIAICFMIPLAVLAVVFRLLIRWHMRIRLGADDYTIIAGMIFAVADISLMIWGNYAGNGKWLDDLSASELRQVLLWYYVSDQLYSPAITCIKLSVLLMYRRIFIYRWFLIWTNCLIALVLAWYLTAAFLTAFQCHPVQAYWDVDLLRRPGAHCLNDMEVILGLQIPNFVLDVLILATPIFALQKLMLTTAKRIGISLVFLVGGLSVAVSATRLGVIISETSQHDNVTHTTGKIVWSVVELGVDVLAACLPTYSPLLRTHHKVRAMAGSLHTIMSRKGNNETLKSVDDVDGSEASTHE